MVVAIDGPAGVGKSSLAEKISKGFGFFNLNSGSFYRAAAVKVLDSNIDYDNENNEKELIKLISKADLNIVDKHLYLDGADVENRLRTPEVDRASSVISSIVEVRHIINDKLRRIGENISLVAEGRDMTTVVFPKAEVKIYLDAGVSVRAKRRFNQESGKQTLEEIEKSIIERDNRDRNKKEGSLKIADDAVVLDSSTLTLTEVYDKVSGLIKAYL